MPKTTTDIRKDHKKWKCNGNVDNKPCGKVHDMGKVYCECGNRRQINDEALAADGSTIGQMYRLEEDMTEHWEYISPEPL
ncbi:hypothetical protein HG530_007077 [Fusarium avenaceum]|nr:hypothetical protein HG530_007077 [Fusarium avenaceum]